MTNKQKCLAQWRWLIKHPGSTKEEWAIVYPEAAKEVKDHALCHACLEVYSQGLGCKHCPVWWNNGIEYDHCCYGENVYKLWNENKTSENAKAVYEVIDKTWK